MDRAIQESIKTIGQLAVDSKIFSGEITNMFDASFVKGLEKNISEIRADFLKNNTDLDDARKLYEEGVRQLIDGEVTDKLVDYAQNNQKAVSFDWRFSAEDVVFGINEILPNLNILSLGASEDSGEWIEKINIEGKVYEFKLESEDRMHEIIEAVNENLKKDNMSLIGYETGGDYYTFLLVDSLSSAQFLDLGFYLV